MMNFFTTFEAGLFSMASNETRIPLCRRFVFTFADFVKSTENILKSAYISASIVPSGILFSDSTQKKLWATLLPKKVSDFFLPSWLILPKQREKSETFIISLVNFQLWYLRAVPHSSVKSMNEV